MKDKIIERIEKIGELWFLREPLLFAVYCTHKFTENQNLKVPFRTGKRVIEYSPEILSHLDNQTLDEFLKIEILRILLKHPYQRQPPFAKRKVLTQASNITINDVYNIKPFIKKYMNGLDYDLPSGLCFEEYYNLVFKILSNGTPHTNCGTSIVPSDIPGNPQDNDEELDHAKNTQEDFQDSNNSTEDADKSTETNTNSTAILDNSTDIDYQISALWEEDEDLCCDINNLIEVAETSNTWGNLPGNLKVLIKASLKIEMDYRKMLSIFRTSVISSKRRLTRMKPNRRFGFKMMGNRYELATNLLIAVDVSGSVTDYCLKEFFSIINRFFKYGVEKLDVIQFDNELKTDKPISFSKAKKVVKITGRGGTDFQAAADYYCFHPEYDGLIYFTDGYAPPPVFNTKRNINVLWILTGKKEYEQHKDWIKKLSRNKATYIPCHDYTN